MVKLSCKYGINSYLQPINQSPNQPINCICKYILIHLTEILRYYHSITIRAVQYVVVNFVTPVRISITVISYTRITTCQQLIAFMFESNSITIDVVIAYCILINRITCVAIKTISCSWYSIVGVISNDYNLRVVAVYRT